MTEPVAQPPEDGVPRRADVRRDEHAGILKSLAQADLLALAIVGVYYVVHPGSLRTDWKVIAALTVFGLLIAALRWPRFPVRGHRSRIALGAAGMVAFITIVAGHTGGTDSPLVNLYLLPVVVVAMTLGRLGTVVVFAGVALAYLSVALDGGPPTLSGMLVRLFGVLGPFAVVAYLTQALTGTLVHARRRIEEMAERDGLTGLLNLRTFRAILAREHALRERTNRGLYGLLMVDMDGLKELNDAHGHQAGNAAIMTVSSAIQRAIRASDIAGRYGGDEFVVLLPDATPEVAESVAQRVRNSVYKSLFPVGDRLKRMTVSVGAASYPRDGRRYEDVLAAADRKMYRDKELRRRGAAGERRASGSRTGVR